jgi:hypothetical protein
MVAFSGNVLGSAIEVNVETLIAIWPPPELMTLGGTVHVPLIEVDLTTVLFTESTATILY